MVYLTEWHVGKVRPRGHVLCAVCGRHKIIEAGTCERLAEMWKSDAWARENGTHTCEACWAGQPEEAA